MYTESELKRIIGENSALEDPFIIDAKLRIESYKESMKMLCLDDYSQKRITLYSEDMPLYKILANIKY